MNCDAWIKKIQKEEPETGVFLVLCKEVREGVSRMEMNSTDIDGVTRLKIARRMMDELLMAIDDVIVEEGS